MSLHAITTNGDTKRWTRSGGPRVYTRSLQYHISIGGKVRGESTPGVPTFALYKGSYSSAFLSRYCKVVTIDLYHALKKSPGVVSQNLRELPQQICPDFRLNVVLEALEVREQGIAL